MRGTASASESPRPDDYLSRSYDEHLSLHSWSFLKKLDIVGGAFWGCGAPMGGCGGTPICPISRTPMSFRHVALCNMVDDVGYKVARGMCEKSALCNMV